MPPLMLAGVSENRLRTYLIWDWLATVTQSVCPLQADVTQPEGARAMEFDVDAVLTSKQLLEVTVMLCVCADIHQVLRTRSGPFRTTTYGRGNCQARKTTKG